MLNIARTIKQVQAARAAIRRRRVPTESFVMARKAGMAANGSTRTKIDVNAMTENWSSSATMVTLRKFRTLHSATFAASASTTAMFCSNPGGNPWRA